MSSTSRCTCAARSACVAQPPMRSVNAKTIRRRMLLPSWIGSARRSSECVEERPRKCEGRLVERAARRGYLFRTAGAASVAVERPEVQAAEAVLAHVPSDERGIAQREHVGDDVVDADHRRELDAAHRYAVLAVEVSR